MSKKEKLIGRLLSKPKDFTFDELVTLMGYLGYFIDHAGKTGGSRVSFKNEDGNYLKLHKPHPRNTLLRYQVEDVIQNLKERSLI